MGFFEVYYAYLKIGIMKCKSVAVSHTEFQQNLCKGLWDISATPVDNSAGRFIICYINFHIIY
jgi:hypothetical protein